MQRDRVHRWLIPACFALNQCLSAQTSVCPKGQVSDATGAPVARAVVSALSRPGTAAASTGAESTEADASGGFALRCPGGWAGGVLKAEAPGLASGEIAVGAGQAEIRLILRPTAAAQQVEVTATRAAVALGPHAETIDLLTTTELIRFPSLTLDEALRQHAGFELFRRSSSWTANPTSQGISLRGLGSTAASRTLVLLDQAPLNDPFGSWVHWNELPPEAISAVAIATGGGSDLYGSSALGGVVDVVPTRSGRTFGSGAASAAGEDTSDEHGLLGLGQGPWSELFAAQGFRTAGYIPVAPENRGAVDMPANVHFENGRSEFARSLTTGGRAFLNGNLLNEARGNGTPVQTNGTRLWRWAGGDDWSAGQRSSGRVRLFGSNEGYRQSFSAVNAARSLETLTRLQRVRTSEVGASADSAIHWSREAIVFGADLRDLRATDLERPVSHGQVASVQDTSARQRFVGGFAELLSSRGAWSAAASLRADSAQNLDTRTLTTSSTGTISGVHLANREEVVLSPRLGLTRTLPAAFAVHAAGFRAFRTPSMNELYRTGQVGQELTEANPQLRSERATGAEGGISWSPRSSPVDLRANYFWTAVNRPVSAVLIASTPTTLTNLRENLGQIVSQGVESSAQLRAGRAISGTLEYQYAHATVTQFAANPAIVGRWIPQVPRHSFTAQLRASSVKWGTLTLSERASGQAFDDSSNTFRLRRFNQLDVYVDHGLRHGVIMFASVQNLLNQRADVARTPVLTLGIPVLAQGGIRYTWRGDQQ